MIESAKWTATGWTREDGFLKSEVGAELLSKEALIEYGFHAEAHEVGDFTLILRRSGGGEIHFSINRGDATGKFVYVPVAGPSINLREWDLGEGGQDSRVMLEARSDENGFRVRMNGYGYSLDQDRARELLSAAAHGYPESGAMGVRAGGAGERWAWLALSRTDGLRAQAASRVRWEQSGGTGRPLMLHSLSAESGTAGDEITIRGEGFSSRTRVQIGNDVLASRFVSSEELVFSLDEDNGTGPLILRDPAEPTAATPPISFQVRRRPLLNQVVPDAVEAGEVFRLFGERLTDGKSMPELRLDDSEPLEILQVGPDMIEARAPRAERTLRDLTPRLLTDGMEARGELKLTVEVWSFNDLVEQSHLARWRNGRPGEEGILTFGAQGDPREGAAALLERVRLEDGNIHDRVLYSGAPDPDQIMLDGFYPDEKLKPGSRLFLKFGFRHDARSSDGVKFSVHFYHRRKRDWYVVMPGVFKVYDGEIASRIIELDEVLPLREWRESEGKDLSGAFSLRVEPGASGRDDHACWLDARVGAL